jgi:hypothetical protein
VAFPHLSHLSLLPLSHLPLGHVKENSFLGPARHYLLSPKVVDGMMKAEVGVVLSFLDVAGSAVNDLGTIFFSRRVAAMGGADEVWSPCGCSPLG